MIWTQTSGLIGLNFFHYKIILHLCNFPFWHRGQVFCRWRDSCGFIGSAFPNTLVFVTHRGPLSKNGKCPHAHLLSKKKIDLNVWEKEKTCLTFIEYERGSEVNFLAQSRHWLYKKSFLVTYSYENKTMVAIYNSFKPGKSHPHSKTTNKRRKAWYVYTWEVSGDSNRNDTMSVEKMRNTEIKYTVPFICPQDHFAYQALPSFSESGQ